MVRPGQTLYQISRSYHVEESYLARINGISDPTRLAIGQRVFIPGARSVRSVPATLPDVASRAVAPPSVTHKARPKPPVQTEKPAPEHRQRPTVQAGRKSSAGKPVVHKNDSKSPSARARRGTFVWPVRGRIVKRFGGQGSKASNGIEIATPRGSSVTSAAAGKVIYSGNGISGYGNLVILQHDNSYYSVYGFNSRNLVKAGKFVSKGQKIALSGIPPSGGTPRLYFEVRHGKRPVNPIFYLP